MYINVYRIGFIALISASYVTAYQKFCYTTYDYRNDQARKQRFAAAMHKESPVRPKKKADYIFSYPNGKGRCFVQMTGKDKRKIRALLSSYEAQRTVDESFIRQVAKMHRKHKEFVWILEDFRRKYPSITVGGVMQHLAC